MIVQHLPSVAVEVKPGNYELNQLFSALTALLEDDEYDDDFLRPTTYAIEQVRKWLSQTSQLIVKMPSGGHLSTDGSGGLRVEWAKGSKEIRLIVPATKEQAAFVYHEDGADYGADQNISSLTIAKWLTWLSK
jgi:hypothetical protein